MLRFAPLLPPLPLLLRRCCAPVEAASGARLPHQSTRAPRHPPSAVDYCRCGRVCVCAALLLSSSAPLPRTAAPQPRPLPRCCCSLRACQVNPASRAASLRRSPRFHGKVRTVPWDCLRHAAVASVFASTLCSGAPTAPCRSTCRASCSLPRLRPPLSSLVLLCVSSRSLFRCPFVASSTVWKVGWPPRLSPRRLVGGSLRRRPLSIIHSWQVQSSATRLNGK